MHRAAMPTAQMQNKAQNASAPFSPGWTMHGCSIWAQRGPLDICYFFIHLFHCHLQEQREKCLFSSTNLCAPFDLCWERHHPGLVHLVRQIRLVKSPRITKIKSWSKHCTMIVEPCTLGSWVQWLFSPSFPWLAPYISSMTFGLCGMKLKKYPLKCKTKLSEKYDVGFDCWKR